MKENSKPITYFIVNPGGNTTAIVRGSFPSKERRALAKQILKTNRAIEQVGFWMPAKTRKAMARLEMAGGEFCGNATRSLAALLGRKGPFYISVSGLQKPVKVTTTKNGSSVELPLNTFRVNRNVFDLPGISHVLLQRAKINKETAQKILKNNGLLQKEAAGVMAYTKHRSGIYELMPVVWVRDVKTLIAETACASGTAALAYACWKSSGKKSLLVRQPSGTIYKTAVDRDGLTITGPILSIKEEQLSW